MTPALSVVLPIHDEAAALADSVARLDAGCATLVASHEILLMENGSHDDTLAVAEELAGARPHVRVFTESVASYGQAMRAGLVQSRGEAVAVLNADLWDLEFLRAALALLDEVDVVVGSKTLAGARDERPALRRAITVGFNLWLRHGLGYPGTDTHGMKVFRREALGPLVGRCVTRHLLFDTELLLRASRRGLAFAELPVVVRELRPARSSVASRVLPTLREAVALRQALTHEVPALMPPVGLRHQRKS